MNGLDDKKTLRWKIDLLQKAKKYLKKGDPATGICYAIGQVTEKMPMERRFCGYDIKNYIHRAIRGEVYLEGWLCRRADEATQADFAAVRAAGFKKYARKMYETRIAWIDWMIAQYEQQLKEI